MSNNWIENPRVCQLTWVSLGLMNNAHEFGADGSFWAHFMAMEIIAMEAVGMQVAPHSI